MKILVDVIGWIGALALLTAYGLVSLRRIEGDASGYQRLNLVGGACLVVNTVYYGAYPSSLVNLVWIGIAIYTMSRKRINA
ncbi:MAG: hypothetical protein HY782_01845 [Chloroflexi bacterium]|nr:hypothetical protein [Chloroflexota bacterium]